MYYYYGHLPDAAQLVEQEKAKLRELGMTGRVLIGEEGMNGTVEGTVQAAQSYVDHLMGDVRFRGVHMKRSKGNGQAFPKLSVKLRHEIVAANLGVEDCNPAEFTAPYIHAEELKQWFDQGKDFVIIDMRNEYEHAVGHFIDSVLPPMRHFRDLPKLMDTLELYKNRTVVTVCTGGVRCEKASGFLLRRGFREVYQLYGGMVTYMEMFPNQEYKGKLYVFDSRVVMGFETDSPQHVLVGRCKHCGSPSEKYVNDDSDPNRPHFICCDSCLALYPKYSRAGLHVS